MNIGQNNYNDGNNALQEQYTPANAPGQTEGTPRILKKRIGSTTYRVCIHFGQTSTESMNDKIARKIRNEASGQ